MLVVVVQVNENNLLVFQKDKDNSLTIVGFTEEGNIGFKRGQEVSIYYDGSADFGFPIGYTYPYTLSHVKKIEIVKEKSSIEIPTKYVNTKNKVNVSIEKITNTQITFSVLDTNDTPYRYPNHYKIEKKVKNENYTGIGEKVGEDTETSLSGYTRSRF